MARTMGLAITLTFITLISASFSSTSSKQDIAPHKPDLDLDGDIVRGALSDNLKHTLTLIEQAESLPSCGRIATSALLHSCSALEGSVTHEDGMLPPGSDLLIEEESDIYAARLAVCELKSADFSVPPSCRSFLPTSGRKSKKLFKGWLSSSSASKPRLIHDYYEEVTESSLKQCRKALGSSGQAWTSYSNNRQNAVAMCHAMQSAVERDESRHIAKILTHTAAAAGESFQDIEEKAGKIKEQFHELRTAMPKFQSDLATFDEDLQQRVQAYWEQFDHARTGLESLTTSIDDARHGMEEARELLNAVLKSHIPELGRAIAAAGQNAQDSLDSAVASSDLVAFNVQQMEHKLIGRLESAGYGLAAINDLMPQLSAALHSHINNSLEMYEIATAKQHELAAVQDDTMRTAKSVQQMVKDTDTLVQHIQSVLKEVTSLLSVFAGLLEGLQGCGRFAGVSVVFALGTFTYWKARLDIVGAVSITTACTIVYTMLLVALWWSTIMPHSALWQWLAFVGLAAVDALVVWSALPVVSSFICPSPASEATYDPFSPPTGIRAWYIWLMTFPGWSLGLNPLGYLTRRRRVTSFRKSVV